MKDNVTHQTLPLNTLSFMVSQKQIVLCPNNRMEIPSKPGKENCKILPDNTAYEV